MSYRVRIESFEGPFDLLLYLVSRQKVDIGSISITEITDQYLAEVQKMRAVDLDVASDFLLVASTLLEIKAASLLPSEKLDIEEEFEDVSPNEMREKLVEHLVEYKKFKNAAQSLQARFEREERMHVRNVGPDRSLLTLVPDYLKGVSLERLGSLCANIFARRDVFLLESDHIADRVIPVEVQIKTLFTRVKNKGRLSFSECLNNQSDPHLVVVTFLAILELYKRSMITLEQKELFDDIEIIYLEGSDEMVLEDEIFDSFIGA